MVRAGPGWFFELVPTKLPHYVLPIYPGDPDRVRLAADCQGYGRRPTEALAGLARPRSDGRLPCRDHRILPRLLVGIPVGLAGGISIWSIAAALAVVGAAWFGFRFRHGRSAPPDGVNPRHAACRKRSTAF